ncbi:hypothetical protein EDC96DRAFT_549567 [Choanephora cucurbitarum]|nr:hypothetical protein EDC96DRAFT_549567 [Choanephora cucurbitarum]
MLYLPWNNEVADLINIDVADKFEQNKGIILSNRNKFSLISDESIEEFLAEAQRQADMDNNEVNEDLTNEDERLPNVINPFRASIANVNMNNLDDKCNQGPADCELNVNFEDNMIADDELDPDRYVANLNMSQRAFLNHVNEHICHNKEWLDGPAPLKLFVTGRAGTSKSMLIKTLYQALIKHYDEDTNRDFNSPTVLLTAPTVKAAFNINVRLFSINDAVNNCNANILAQIDGECLQSDCHDQVVDPVTLVFKRRLNSSLLVKKTHFPLTVAEAVTIYKSQGSTYNRVCIDISGKALNRSLLYVACPRATSASGLYLIAKSGNYTYQLVFHNVESLKAHVDQIINDKSYLVSDFLLFAETWANSQHIFSLPGVKEASRTNVEGSTPRANGSICFINNSNLDTELVTNIYQRLVTDDDNHQMSISAFIYNDLLIASVYRSPRFSLDRCLVELKELLRTESTHMIVKGISTLIFMMSKTQS